MAKNVVSEKKRITHIGNITNKNLKSDSSSSMSECIDYVQSIMKEMDSSMTTVSCNKSQLQEAKVKQMNPQSSKMQNSSTLLSNDNSQSLHIRASKLKKYSIMSKYPLMVKSQKCLNQIKHNRNMPKQRAHLASIPKSPLKKVTTCSSGLPRNKTKNGKCKQKVKNLIKKNTETKKINLNDDSCIKKKCLRSDTSKNMKAGNNSQFYFEQNKPQKIQEKTVENTKDSLTEDTTDSEYERFVEKNKMELQKEILIKPKRKNKRISRTNKKTSVNKKKKSRKKSQEINESLHYKSSPLHTGPEQYDSNFNNDSSSDSEYDNVHIEYRKVSDNVPIITKSSTFANNENLNSEFSDIKENACTDNCCPQFCVQDELSGTSSCNYFEVQHNSDLATYSKEFISKDSLLKANVLINDTSVNELSQNPAKTKITECHIVSSGTCSSTSKYSENPSHELNLLPESSNAENSHELDLLPESSVVINLSSDTDNEPESILEPAKVLVKEENHEMTVKTQNASLHIPNNEEPDVEIIKVVSSVRKIFNAMVDNEHPVVVDSRSLQMCDSDDKCHFSNEITKYSITTKTNNSSEGFMHSLSKSVLSKEEVKNSVALCSERYVAHAKINSNNIHSATYVTNICKDYNGVKNDPVTTDVTPVSIKQEKGGDDDDVVIIDSAESDSKSQSYTDTNIVKERMSSDDDIIIINSVMKNQSKNISKIDFDCNSLQNGLSCASVKQEGMLNSVLEKPIINSTNFQESQFVAQKEMDRELHSLIQKISDRCLESSMHKSYHSNDNCSAAVKSNVKFEYPASVGNLEISSKHENTPLTGIESLNHVEFPEGKVPTEQNLCNEVTDNLNVLHLRYLYNEFKREFQNYQEIIRTEANVQAGLKFVEGHQAQKLTCIRSKIQNLLKNNPSFLKMSNDSMKVKEQSISILKNNSVSSNIENSTQNKFQLSPNGFSRDTSANVVNSNLQDTLNRVNEIAQTLSQKDAPVSGSSVAVKMESEEKPFILCSDNQISLQIQHHNLSCKSENNLIANPTLFSLEASPSTTYIKTEETTSMLMDQKCSVCGKKAIAACQRCAKAFFCSHKCGKKSWDDGHEYVCGK